MFDTNTVPTLKDKCMTVCLKRSQYYPRKYDRAATGTVERAAGAVNVGRFNKTLLKGCKELKTTQQKFADVYTYVVKNSLPWMNDGVRIIPNRTYIDFQTEYNRLKGEAMGSVTQLYNAWDAAVQADRVVLGALFEPSDYPTKDEMAQMWDIRLVVAPISDGGDFRIEMDDDTIKELNREIAKVESDSTTYVLKELLGPISAMADKLVIPAGTEGSVFRDTLVSNVKDIAVRAKKLNINNDDRIDETCAEVLSVLQNITPDDLRTSPVTRSSVAARMTKLEKKINEWF